MFMEIFSIDPELTMISNDEYFVGRHLKIFGKNVYQYKQPFFSSLLLRWTLRYSGHVTVAPDENN